MRVAHNRLDLTGRIFGMLEVIEYSHNEVVFNKSQPFYKCHCNRCGNDVVLLGAYIRQNYYKTCGCGKWKRESPPKPISKESTFNDLYVRYKQSAKVRNLPFCLSEDFAKNMMSLNCFYCGRPPSAKIKRGSRVSSFLYNRIDRMDNSKGYVEGNVVPCCKICNQAKNNLSYDEFINWIHRLSDSMMAREILHAFS